MSGPLINLSKESPLDTIQAGDPFTFIRNEPFLIWSRDGVTDSGGFIIYLHKGAELLFEVCSVTVSMRAEAGYVYETRFVKATGEVK